MADTLPRCFFFYGKYRDDAWQESYYKPAILKDIIDAKTAKLYKHKMYQRTREHTPFAIKTNNDNDYIIGRLITYDDSVFDAKLKKIKKIKACKPADQQDGWSHFESIETVYLINDKQKANPIKVRVYIRNESNQPLNNCIQIDSNDWMQRNVLVSEIKTKSNNRIHSGKGGVRLSSSRTRKYFKEWKSGAIYEKGDIVAVEPKKKKSYGPWIKSFTLWAMCINKHESNESNKPYKDDIFIDLLLNITSFIKVYLIEHVKGFNCEVTTIIIDYCYQANNVWWNGCAPVPPKNKATCGNLVSGIMSTQLCKICYIKQLGIDDENKENYKMSEPLKGAVICLNKNNGAMQRQYIMNNSDENKEENKSSISDENIIFQTNIENENEKQKIYNLLSRNF
eukprot:146272_1